MKKVFLRFIGIVLVVAAFALVSCGGGGGGGGGADPVPSSGGSGGTGGNPGGNTGGGTVQPAVPGFAVSLTAGDYWEYRWDDYSYSWAQGSSSTTSMQTGRFRVSLGPATVINGTQAYPVEISGVPRNFAPRWKYLAVKDTTLLGSTDGLQFSVIFDAQNGFWPGGGFFVDLGSTSLNQAQAGTVAGVRNITQYISGSALRTGLAGSQSTCQYYPGVGNICGDSSFTFDRWEYYLPNLGPYGFYYYNTFSDCGGGFCSGATWEQMVGLVSSSLRGDTVDYVLENEPNDSPATAQLLTNGVAVKGAAWPFAAGWDVTGLGILIGPDTYGWSVIEDLYKFTLPLSTTARPVTISLDFPSAAGSDTDYDIYLLNGNGTSVIASSTGDNKGTGVYTETITYSLSSGPFLVGVEAFSNSTKAEYTLTVSW